MTPRGTLGVSFSEQNQLESFSGSWKVLSMQLIEAWKIIRSKSDRPPTDGASVVSDN